MAQARGGARKLERVEGAPPAPGTKDQDDNRRRPEDIPEDEKALVVKLLDDVESAKRRTRVYREELLPLFRGYAWGTRFQENEQGSTAPIVYRNTRTNLCFATMATLLPHVYAKQPEIAVAPTEAAGEEQYQMVKQFAQTAQTLLARCFVKEARLKTRAKMNVRSAMATGVGWLKLGFQESLSGDPIIIQRHNDLQDNLQRIEHLIVKTRRETDVKMLNLEREELRQQIETVRAQKEVLIYKGFVLDRVLSEDLLILDDKVREFDAYDDAEAMAHGVWFTADQYEQQFGYGAESCATEYGPQELHKTSAAGGDVHDEEKPQATKYLRVWEIWKKKDGKVYTVCEGMQGYCRPPFTPQASPKRWYPFYGLAFNQVEGRVRPIADIELLYQLQDEYNVTRYFYAEARKESVPVRVFRKTGEMTEQDINNLKNRRARQWIGVEGNPNVPLANDIMQLEPFKVNPEDFDVSMIRNDMDMLVGLSDASRANLIEAKTATEAEIMRQALMSRAAERQDAHEDLISVMAEACLQIMLQKFSPQEVAQLAGQQAQWPTNLPLDQIYQLVDVSVRAGSTGKPDQGKDREQWAVIMPILKDTAAQVAELRATGEDEMADSLVELLKETLKRYDERIDIDRFIPRDEKDPQTGQSLNKQRNAAKMQQMMLQNQQLTEELQKCQEALQKAQTQEQSRIADAQAKQAIETAKASSELERDRMKQTQEAAAADREAAAEAARMEREMQAKEADHVREMEQKDADHERELAAREREAMIKVAGDVLVARIKAQTDASKEAAKSAQEELSQTHDHYEKITSQLADLLGAIAGDIVPEYDEEDTLTSVSREPATLLGGDGMERLLQAVQLLSRAQTPEYDNAGRIVRVSRSKAPQSEASE